ncbi:HAD hydrolase-like protein [Phreatobacter stygius]|nr:HAD hydrolase-like protein [Phreatobacter stygius]
MSYTVLFDLDGTLTDPAPGIIGCFQQALTDLGHETPPFDELKWIIGPSLRSSFPKFMPDGADVETALARYRLHYGGGGLYDLTVYPGMPEAVALIRSEARRLFVCTAKPETFARPIIDRFGYAPLFDQVYGTTLDGSLDDKGDLMAKIIAEQGFDPARAIMVGDRKHDILAARRHGIASIGVTWGYGGAQELSDTGATHLCERPEELAGLVKRIAADWR